MNCGSEDPGTAKRVRHSAKRVRHRVLVSKKGVAAAHRRLEPGECVFGRAQPMCGSGASVPRACVQECPPPSSSWRQARGAK